MNRLKHIVLPLLFFISLKNASATDRNFVYTYESRTLQGGLRELETWVSYNYGKGNFYSAVQNRLEFEIGLGKRLQTSIYLNLNAETLPVDVYSPVTDGSGNVIFEKQSILETHFNVGFSNEWKYQLSDPVANKLGSALYAEIGVSPDKYELETKVILDKKFKRWITALNLVGEFEWDAENNEEKKSEWEQETELEADYGLVYTLPKNFALGFEVRNRNVIDEGAWEHSALYAGPVFSYKSNNWWLSLGVQPQLTDLKNGGLTLEDDEKINARVVFAYSL
jgi:hypothetical protein